MHCRSLPSADRLRVLVLGYLVRGPLGGLAWHHLQYVMGLMQLGHDVYFMEDSDDYPGCYDPDSGETGTDPTYGLRFTGETFARLGFGNRWAYFDAPTNRWLGPRAGDARLLCATADLVLNVSGVNPLRSWHLTIPIRVFIDTDPVFTQLRHLQDPGALTAAQGHNVFFTFGENLVRGTGNAGEAGDGGIEGIPDDGLAWRPTRQPIVLDAWRVEAGPKDAPFTTVMQWDSYPAREFGGRRYGMKSESFGPYLDLPRRSGCPFELALAGSSAPRDLLQERGWVLRDPQAVTRNPWTYQDYIRQSRAEFTVAKQGYILGRCGWFSERSAAYLASGRPVVTQDTGFSRLLPTGEGLLAFATPDQALAAIDDVKNRYAFHCRRARDVVESFFDARIVLSGLLGAAVSNPV